MTTIVTTAEFEAWFASLPKRDAKAVDFVVSMLKQAGVQPPFPYSSAITGSRYALRELRRESAGRVLRVLYAFDPERQAVLLIGGDKRGDKRFYEREIPRAERL